MDGTGAHLIEVAAERGLDMKDLPLRTGIFGAEPWTDSMRLEIEERFGFTPLIIDLLARADQVHLMGPGQAKLELKQRIQAHKPLARIPVALETVDRLTDAQVVARAREIFGVEGEDRHDQKQAQHAQAIDAG